MPTRVRKAADTKEPKAPSSSDPAARAPEMAQPATRPDARPVAAVGAQGDATAAQVGPVRPVRTPAPQPGELPPVDQAAAGKAPRTEIGTTGLRRYGGWVREELLPELQGTRGARIYREMRDNDAIVGAIAFVIEMLAREVEWSVKPAEGDTTPEGLAIAQFVSQCLFEDMANTWQDTIAEILTFITFGWSFAEMLYKRRLGPEGETPSRFNDGRLGWAKWGARAQETLWRWEFDENGEILGMWQQAPPDFKTVYIPMERSLLFRTTTVKNNPEGRSIFRNAYRSWYFKKRIEEIEGIGVERDLAGLPVLIPPANLDLWNSADPAMVSAKAAAENLIRGIRRDDQEGVLLPFGWELKLLTSAGRRNFDTTGIVTRYDQRLAMCAMADFILLGHTKVGTQTLASTKADMFTTSLEALLHSIAATINRRAIPELLKFNGIKADKPPTLSHGSMTAPDLAALAAYITALAGAGAIFMDGPLEAYLREVADMPLPPEDEASVAKRATERAVRSVLRPSSETAVERIMFIEAITKLRESLEE